MSKSQGSAPVRDEVDNYTLMRAMQNDSHTIIEFRRVLDTCDLDDYVLSVSINNKQFYTLYNLFYFIYIFILIIKPQITICHSLVSVFFFC